MTFDELWDATQNHQYVNINWITLYGTNNHFLFGETDNVQLYIVLKDCWVVNIETAVWTHYNYLEIDFDYNNLVANRPNILVSSDGNTYTQIGNDLESFPSIRIIGQLWSFNDGTYTYAQIKAEMERFVEHTSYISIDAYWKSTILSTFTCMFYNLSCEKHVVNKASFLSLYYVGSGQLTEECDILNPSFLIQCLGGEIANYPLFTANYVYIEKFKRYYFITGITNVRNDLWRITTHVDVLYSYNTDIRKQYGYIVRNEDNPYGVILPDERVSFFAEPSYTFTDVTGGTNANITLGYTDNSELHIALSIINDTGVTSFGDISAPYLTNLPNIKTGETGNPINHIEVLNTTQWRVLAGELASQQTLATFIGGAWSYPFTLNGIVATPHTFYTLRIGTTDLTAQSVHGLYDTSPYFIVADFTLPSYNSFEDIEPYTYCDLIIPYYNGTYRFNLQRCAGHNIWVYYSVQFSNGNAFVYVYDYTEQQILMTAPVPLAQQLPITTTNAYEINQQRTLSNLGYIGNTMDWLFKAISSGVGDNILGVFTSSQKWVGDTIQWGFNQSLMKDTANVSITSANGGFFTPQKVFLITTKRQKNIADLQTFETRNGYPINTWDYLSTTGYEYTGYTEITQLHYTPSSQKWITSPEIDEIENLAKNGIIL